MRRVDLSGKRFGELHVLRAGRFVGGHLHWECSCSCGKALSAASQNLRKGKTRSCGCLRKRAARFNNWEGYQEISGDYWSSLKRGAAARNLSFEINLPEMWALFMHQQRRCALTGEPIVFSTRGSGIKQTASLDRKYPSQGYLTNNVQWVHKKVNFCKGTLSNDEFIALCHAVVAKKV